MGIASPSHLIILLVIMLLLFGAKRIPELARGLGEGMREFRKGTDELGGDEPSRDDRPDDADSAERGEKRE